jgi:tetratricopeptide (TPR) repeat protein
MIMSKTRPHYRFIALLPIVLMLVIQPSGLLAKNTDSAVGVQHSAPEFMRASFSPVQQRKSLRQRIIEWLQRVSKVRNPIVPYIPEGRIEPTQALSFRWKYDQNPDHFLIRVLDGRSKEERWLSPSIPGTARSYSADVNLTDRSVEYLWRIEAYADRETNEFSKAEEQFFSFIPDADLSEVRRQETVLRQWLKDRPDDREVLILLGSYYSQQEVFDRARSVFSELLNIRGPEQFTYEELKKQVEAQVAQNIARFTTEEAALAQLTGKQQRLQKLPNLLRLSLLCFQYESALQYLDELISLSSKSDRSKWEQQRAMIVNEQAFAQRVFPEETRSVQHHYTSEGRATSTEDPVTVTLEMNSDSALWFLADAEFFEENLTVVNPIVATYREGDDRPLVSKDSKTFHLDEDEVLLIKGLWAGNIASRNPFIEREIFNLLPVLREVRSKYLASHDRTPSLDNAWRLIDRTQSLRDEINAVNRFARIVYPDLDEPEATQLLKQRDELVKCLSRFWTLSQCDEDDDRCLALRKFYDILLWRTSPVFELEIKNNGSNRLVIDSIEVLPEDFHAKTDLFKTISTLVGAPQQEPTVWSFMLDGKLNPRYMRFSKVLAPGQSINKLIRFESTQKGMHTLRVAVRAKGSVLWKSQPLNLYFMRDQ